MLYFSTYQSSRQNKKLFEWLFSYLNSFLKFKLHAFCPLDQSEYSNLIWLEKLAPKPLLHWPIVLLPSSYTDHYVNRMWIFGDPQSTSVIPYFNLIPWCQFKEMDQGHEMSFLILNREVKRMVFCLNRMKVWRPFGTKPLPKIPFSVPPPHPRHPREF